MEPTWRQSLEEMHSTLTQLRTNISIRKMHWLTQGLRIVNFSGTRCHYGNTVFKEKPPFKLVWSEVTTRLLCPWDFPGNSPGMDCQFLLRGIFPTQGWNPGLPHCRQTLYRLSHQESSKVEMYWWEARRVWGAEHTDWIIKQIPQGFADHLPSSLDLRH